MFIMIPVINAANSFIIFCFSFYYYHNYKKSNNKSVSYTHLDVYKRQGEPRTDFVEPRAFMRDLSAMMEDDAILTADVGQNQIWAANNFNTKEGRFLTSGLSLIHIF